MYNEIQKRANWLDDRLGIQKFTRKSLNKVFPDHWSFMIGEIALYSFIILIGTGVFLTFFYIPSTKEIIYHGPYKPLIGQKVSEAYASSVNLNFTVRAGLLMRQIHHWAADVFIAAIVVHMIRIFFTGAFRRPRELNWMIGVMMMFLAIMNGFLGYSLPDDLVSGTGIRIAFSILLSIPVVGSYLAFFFFGGNYPGTTIMPRFFIAHVLIVPVVIGALLGAHLAIMWHQKHTQFRGNGATERNVVGSVLWPTYAFKTLGYFLLTTAVLGLLGGFMQINPIWQYGPYKAYHVSYAVQPDWYMGWLDGALRIMPAWEIVGFGHMVPNVFFPAVLLPGITFMLFYLWPFIEDRFTRESVVEHHLLDLPRDRPLRTGVGWTVLTFYIVLFGASATDVLANTYDISLNVVLWAFRIGIVVIPPLAGLLAHRVCRELQTWEKAGTRKRAMIISRSDDGAYHTEEAAPRPGDALPHHTPPQRVPEEVSYALAGRGIEGGEGHHQPVYGSVVGASRSGRHLSSGGTKGLSGVLALLIGRRKS